ncbi:MAG TPA: ATP:cob(I)alamin adenosyltransferase, partial [Prosthecobacter sp.]|nr:ATP:cob(I)alamin adenosyltransferase [Prosthecobacter sp.]
ETREVVATAQPWLITLMGELATPPGLEGKYAATHPVFGADKTAWLDDWVARLESGGALQFKGWALPGEAGVMSGALADVARTVCRRAERCVADLAGTDQQVPNPEIARFLNRLADVLWLLARWEEKTVSEKQSGGL